ncbi:LicD family protein, partial [Gordonibacter sp.]|uniref:LicD family protein n=1 Tax=Gordonibacter sp. TaxID=1968902 RepID=UPI002FC766F0
MRYEQDMLRKLQLVELEILRDIDAVCRTHGIVYFLDSGSALGAVRHGGFIPWDDDIDLGMLRADYERFLEVAPRALGDGYVVADPRKRTDQAGMFAKVWKRGTKFFTEETIDAGIEQGIFVDIFPYDPLHSNPVIARRQQRMCRFWQSMSYLRYTKHITVPHGGLFGSVERGACAVVHAGTHALVN